MSDFPFLNKFYDNVDFNDVVVLETRFQELLRQEITSAADLEKCIATE